jgi:hypothetical protein
MNKNAYQKQRINAMIDFEVYMYHKERGTNLSKICNATLKNMMLYDQEDSNAIEVNNLEKDLEALKQELLSKSSLLLKARQCEEEKLKEQLSKVKVDTLQSFLSEEEKTYWIDTINVLALNPSLVSGRHKLYVNTISNISFDDWLTKREWAEKNTKGV